MMGDAGHAFIKKLRTRSWSMQNKPRCSPMPHFLGDLWAIKMPRNIALIRASCAAGLRMACDGLRPENHRRATAG